MKFFKLSLIIFIAGAFFAGCSSSRDDRTSGATPYPEYVEEGEYASDENSPWARENLDLQAVGDLLEKADNAEEFEYLLNSEDGVNNLDLNGDGDVDYISVAEYENSDDNQRGFTLFDRFGVDEIQEIARIIFDRGGLDSRGARILLTGNEELYGDNYYYETDWRDRQLPIADWAFGNRDNYYQSPYYYENYPSNYEVYKVVETTVYRTRIKEYYPAPVFIKTVNPTISQIKIKSRYNGRSADKIFAKLAKPTKEQKEFRKNNPDRPEFVRVKNGKMKNDSFKNFDKDSFKPEKEPKGNPNNFDRPRKDNKDFDKPRKGNNEMPQMREKPNKFVRENVKPQNPVKYEKREMKPQNNGKQNGGGNKPNGNGNGKGNGNGGGNKGGGKKN